MAEGRQVIEEAGAGGETEGALLWGSGRLGKFLPWAGHLLRASTCLSVKGASLKGRPAALCTTAKGGHPSVQQQTNVVQTYNGPLFGLRKQGSSDTCYDTNEP